MFCKNCGNKVENKAKGCSSCGMNPKKGNHCHACGSVTQDKQVICTQCGANLEPSFFSSRFAISFAWTFSIFVLLILTTLPSSGWKSGLIGSAMFALLSGVIGAAIPTERRIIYIPISIIIPFTIAVIIGLKSQGIL